MESDEQYEKPAITLVRRAFRLKAKALQTQRREPTPRPIPATHHRSCCFDQRFILLKDNLDAEKVWAMDELLRLNGGDPSKTLN